MILILRSFLLSFSVCIRMIVPFFVIGIASMIVWTVVNILTLGLASLVSGPITATFISLFGIRVALAIKGDMRRYELSVLILNAARYGLFIFVLNSILIWVSNLATALFASWQVGEGLSFWTVKEATESAQIAFTFLWLGSNAIVVTVVLAATSAAMAVPLASGAREASHRAPSARFFYGVWQSFLPLLCVFLVTSFVQIYFQLFSFLYTTVPIFMSVVTLIVAQTLPDFELDFILKGVAATAGLVWLNAWAWSASALALLKFDRDPTSQPNTTRSADAPTSADIRALRKSRE